jgi:hypothetical protein
VADHLVGGLHCAEVADLAPSFVLGALEQGEADAVRRHLAGCPEAHAEMAELGSVVPALFEAVDIVEPPSSLRERIMAAAAAEQAALTGVQAADVAPIPSAPRALDAQRALDTQETRGLPRAAVQPSQGRRTGLFERPVWAVAAIAAAFALVALGVWNVQLRDEIAGLTAYRNGVVEVLDHATQRGAQLAVLAPPEDAPGPSGLAAVAADGSVALVMRDLSPTSGAQVYEAWLIAGTGAPVPIGDFRVGPDGTATFSTAHASLGSGVTVALTLEPGPGATTPTMPIIAVGQAAARSS